MSISTPAITNFTAGEWSPKLAGRVDMSKYGQACSELLNMTILPHGAVTRRMGSHFVSTAGGRDIRLIPFIFSEDQAYVLEFTPGTIRFFRSGGHLAGKDLETPYSAEDIRKLGYCQSADVMYLVSGNHAPRKLTRPGADTFTLETVNFTNRPTDWAENNWPGCITFYQQRLWLAGTVKQPQKIWASKTGSFEDFSTGTTDDAGLSISLVSEQVNAVRWLIQQKSLMGGTSGGEWTLFAGSPANPSAITGKTVESQRNSNYGSAAIRPIMAGTSVLHVSADGRRLRGLGYAFAEDAFVSNDISLVAEHLTRPGIRELAFCQNPDSIIWVVLETGELRGVTFLKEQEVGGWHRHETQGKVLSVTCIPAAGFTETWLAVERRNGVFVERMKAPWDGTSTNEPGCWYVDSGLLLESEAEVRRITGLEHLEGQRVTILADGAAHDGRVVKDGAVDLDWPARRVLAGLDYAWAVAPMRLEGLSARGSMQGKKSRILSVTARLYKSLNVNWELPGQNEPPYPLANRDVEMAMDAAPLPYTGDAQMTMAQGWSPDARVRLSGAGAFPVTVIMLVPKAAINE